MRLGKTLLIANVLAAASIAAAAEKTVIKLDMPAPQSVAGGIIVADVDNDGKMDFLISSEEHLEVRANDGSRLWNWFGSIQVSTDSENNGLPGVHAPGVSAGDIDGDGKCEVIILTKDRELIVFDGAIGKIEATVKPHKPKGPRRWELAMIANFRGKGDRDILLQATYHTGYRTGRYLAAYAFEDLLAGKEPLWTTDKFVSLAHGGARLADLNGDGRDEVLGVTILSHEGKELARAAEFKKHGDSIFVADVVPDKPGLEVILLEEGDNYVQVIGMDGPIWRQHNKQQEPQNAAVGRFKKGSDEIFIWCRSRYSKHQKPFVFDSSGKTVFTYEMDDVTPMAWSFSGVEVINTIDWTGERQQLACAKERHTKGDVAIFEPLTGKFVTAFHADADRLYVADVFGDWREEVIILSGNELHIYTNDAPNPRPDVKRLWTNHNYRRMKQNHNYYSP